MGLSFLTLLSHPRLENMYRRTDETCGKKESEATKQCFKHHLSSLLVGFPLLRELCNNKTERTEVYRVREMLSSILRNDSWLPGSEPISRESSSYDHIQEGTTGHGEQTSHESKFDTSI